MRGLPYTASLKDIAQFFDGDVEGGGGIVKNGIIVLLRHDGRPSGEAYVFFYTDAHLKTALEKNKHSMGNRYIEIFKASLGNYIELMKTSNCPKPSNTDVCSCIRLRGLPFEAKEADIISFLREFFQHVIFGGIHLLFKENGTSSGEAVIQMSSEGVVNDTVKTLNKSYMFISSKKRYIEFLPISTSFADHLISKNTEIFNQQNFPYIPQSLVYQYPIMVPSPFFPNQMSGQAAFSFQPMFQTQPFYFFNSEENATNNVMTMNVRNHQNFQNTQQF
uniref:RRM domain-containing protein n=1 Tax=Rhabditophanes sp. KR3021 TaxID=114890 RepID=A0AC35TS44_9BILA